MRYYRTYSIIAISFVVVLGCFLGWVIFGQENYDTDVISIETQPLDVNYAEPVQNKDNQMLQADNTLHDTGSGEMVFDSLDAGDATNFSDAVRVDTELDNNFNSTKDSATPFSAEAGSSSASSAGGESIGGGSGGGSAGSGGTASNGADENPDQAENIAATDPNTSGTDSPLPQPTDQNTTSLGGGSLGGGGPNMQPHQDEVFMSLFNSSYVPVEAYYDPQCAKYFSRDGINNLFYYPSDKTLSGKNFLQNAKNLGMNGVIWVPEFWKDQGFGALDYTRWIKNIATSGNLYAWYMPDELPSVFMQPEKRMNPIFLNKNNPDDINTAIGLTRWYAQLIHNADPKRHIIISPGNGGAMADLDRWAIAVQYLSPYCDIWVRGPYATWLGRPRTMLLYEYEQWEKCLEKASAAGTDLTNLKFMFMLESFKVPANKPVSFIKPEIIRFDAYASLTLGVNGFLWWEGKNWNNPDPAAQAMYEAIFSVGREINIPSGPHLAACLLANEPKQTVIATVIKGPAKVPYEGNSYDSVKVRLKSEAINGQQYLFVANFAQVWNDSNYKCDNATIAARFSGLPANTTKVEIIVDSRNKSVGKTISVSNGSFEDDFLELTARVYKIR